MTELARLAALGRDWAAGGEDVALATVVGVRGSAPRAPGARLIMARSGRIEGSVSGGCVENDVFERALAVLDSRRPETATYGIADELGWEVGLSCGGSIDVLIEPFAPDDDALLAAAEADSTGDSAVLAVALAPGSLTARKALFRDGAHAAGGIEASVDRAVMRDSADALRSEAPAVREYGDVRVFLEPLLPPPHLVIGGGTHAGVHLSAMAQRLGFRVTVIDPRGLFATPDRFPGAQIIRTQPETALRSIDFNARTFVAVLSHDPRFDLPILARALRSPAPYIGAMGSRKTAEDRRAALREMGFHDREIARLHAPIGLDIGAVNPEEIALSVLAEITAARRGRPA